MGSTLQIGIYVEAQEGVTWEAWQRLATRAEELGLDILACSAHLMPLEAPGGWSLDLWPVMAAVALWTRRIHFGPAVLPVTFYPPAQIARLAATVDRLSGGRFELGLGAGRHEGEHRAFGLPFPGHEERLALLKEAVEVIRRLWSGERASYSGRWCRLEGARAEPTPVRGWLSIGGNSEASLRIAATHADEWSTTSAPPEELAARLRRLDELAAEAGRAPGSILRTMMNGAIVGRDGGELERRAGRMGQLAPRLAAGGPTETLRRLVREWGWWAGTPEQVAAQAGAAVALGFGRILFQVYDWEDLAAVDLLAGAIVPRLRAGAGRAGAEGPAATRPCPGGSRG